MRLLCPDQEEDEEIGAFERLMSKGEIMRRLKELALQDEAERAAAGDDETKDAVVTTRSGHLILLYESFLQHQRYYDDSKHINYKYIDYGSRAPGDHNNAAPPLVIEQDHRLGKGGFGWCAGFVLGEYVSEQLAARNLQHHKPTMIELGAGTGLAGLMVAKALDVHVVLTDLPQLVPLMRRNIARNCTLDPTEKWLAQDEVYQEYMTTKPTTASLTKARGSAAASELTWGNRQQEAAHGTFDIVLGADVVASLYDPLALSETLARLSHATTQIYISFKERQLDYHEQFEAAMREKFVHFEIVRQHHSRNRNPGVGIIVASGKKAACEVSE